MPSQFSAIGFSITSGEDLAAVASRVAGEAERVTTPRGEYLKWAPPSGEQLWLQVSPKGDAMGMSPHFAGRSAVRVRVEARVHRETHTPLDGTFLAWATPSGAATGGDYPFAFDCPDAGTHLDLTLPLVAMAQIAAFAQEVSVYDTADAYHAARAAEGLNTPSKSVIPSGLITPSGTPVTPPEPHALIAGHVIEAGVRLNTISGAPFWWALLETIGGTFDVVIDPVLVPEAPRTGNVLAGWFWLSGRLLIEEQRPERPGWLRRLAGG